MEKLFTDLAWKCYQHNLRFEYVPVSEGITVFTDKYELITSGWLDGIPVRELKTMHKEVDIYLKSLEPEAIDTEQAQARLTEFKRGQTEFDRKMKEVGRTENDFL